MHAPVPESTREELSTAPRSDAPAPVSPGPVGRLLTLVVIVGFAALVIIPILLVGVLPYERTSWLLAEAREAELNGDAARAAEIYAELLQTQADTDEVPWRLKRAELLLDANQADAAAAVASELVAAYPDGLREFSSTAEVAGALEHYTLLASALQQQGDYVGAVEQWERLGQIASERLKRDYSKPTFVNNRCYARALADVQLFASFAEMNALIATEYNAASVYHMSGYQHFLYLQEGRRFFKEQPEQRERVAQQALQDYRDSIAARLKELDELQLENQRKRSEETTGVSAETPSPNVEVSSPNVKVSSPNVKVLGTASQGKSAGTAGNRDDAADSDDAEAGESPSGGTEEEATGDTENDSAAATEQDAEHAARQRLNERKRELALVLTHRSLLFELLGDEANATADREQVRELGFSSRELSKQAIAIDVSSVQLANLSAWFDTRGVLLYRLKQYAPARREIERAIRLAEAMRSLGRYALSLRAQQSPDIRREQARVERIERSLAAMLYHLWLIDQATGRTTQMQQWEARLKELGYEPGPSLH